jgi:phosphonate transport system substrate-binding protein
MFSKSLKYIGLFLVSGFLLISCNLRKEEVANIDFSSETDPEVYARETDSVPALRVAIAAVISPKESFVYYRELFDFMSDRLNMKVEFKQRMSYEEVNSLLERNMVDMAFICTGAYLEGSDRFDLLVVPWFNNQPYYYAYLITNEKSGIRTLEDIRGRSFAFTDPLSFTGKAYAIKRLADIGENPETFFGDLTFTMSHDISIQMVSRNLVDAATIDGLIYDYLEIYQPDKIRNVRIIEKSENFGIPPVVSSLLMKPEMKEKIQQLFVEMHEDERGREILDKLLIDRFQVSNDSLYKSARKIWNEVWQ